MTLEQAKQEITKARNTMQKAQNDLDFERQEMNQCTTFSERIAQLQYLDAAQRRFDISKVEYDHAVKVASVLKLKTMHSC